MAIQLIVASGEPRFHDFVREQLLLTPNAEIISEHEDICPNLSVRILHYLNLNPQSAALLAISGEAEQGLRALEQMSQASPGLSAVLSDARCSEGFLLSSTPPGGADVAP